MNTIHNVLALSLMAVSMLFPWDAVLAQDWPQIKAPPGIRLTLVGEQVSQNGLPMRLQAFVTNQSAGDLLAWFQDFFGKRHVVDKVGNTTVIGQAQGDFYLSVQLTPGEKGTHGVLAVSRIKSVTDAVERGQLLVSAVPGESRLMSDTSSMDGGKHGRHIVYTNQYSQEVNRDLLLEFMKDKGFRLEREARLEDKPGQVFFFRDGEREAIAVITRKAHEASVVVNMVSPVKKTVQ